MRQKKYEARRNDKSDLAYSYKDAMGCWSQTFDFVETNIHVIKLNHEKRAKLTLEL